jgi:hypothetical protein
MAPSIDVVSPSVSPTIDNIKRSVQKLTASDLIREPLRYSGSLNEYRSFDVTPVIGREFPEVQLTDILHDDEKLRDLAITGQQYQWMV